MVEMRMGQQHDIDAGRDETERGGIFLVEITAALKQAAIHENSPAAAFEQMARTGHATIGQRTESRVLAQVNVGEGGRLQRNSSRIIWLAHA